MLIIIIIIFLNAQIYLHWAVLQFILRVSRKEYYSRRRHMSTFVHIWHSQKKLDGQNIYKDSFLSANSVNKTCKIFITEIQLYALGN